jgi:hypothetical protein
MRVILTLVVGGHRLLLPGQALGAARSIAQTVSRRLHRDSVAAGSAAGPGGRVRADAGFSGRLPVHPGHARMDGHEAPGDGTTGEHGRLEIQAAR